MQTNITKNLQDNRNSKINYLNSLKDLFNPISNRSGMIINTPYKHLAETKKLMMVGFNPGGVPSENMTTIREDFKRHLDDSSFNALNEEWGKFAAGEHPIQKLYQALIRNTELEPKDILKTNIYWERSSGIPELKIDSIIEKICRKGFLLNIKAHKPKSIMFLSDKSRKIAEKWSDTSLPIGISRYPWGTAPIKIRLYSMKFDGHYVKAFSIPHPSQFSHGDNPDRLNAILEAAKKCDIELEVKIYE